MGAAKRGKRHTEETKQKMRAAKLGYHHTEEAKQKMRKPKSEKAKKNMGRNLKLSPEQATEIRLKRENSIRALTLASEYDVDRCTINDVVNHRNAYQLRNTDRI